MKKISILILLAISLFTLPSCNGGNDEIIKDYQTEETSRKYTLAQMGGEASCLRYKLYDENNNLIEVPADLAEVFECPLVAELSPNTEQVLYSNFNSELKLYDIPSKTEQKLADLDPNNFGETCKWSPEGDKVACALVNQEEYPEMTKVLVFFGFDSEGGITFKQEYDQAMAFTCGSICKPDIFEFDGNTNLKFATRMENGDTTPASLDISL